MEAIAQLEEKLAASMLPYEALQYVQSFVARKKKHLTPNITSQLVFLGAKKLIQDDSPADAGTLLLWFIEGGAGEDNPIHIETKELDSGADLYCDIDRLIQLVKKLDSSKTVFISEKVYVALVKILAKLKIPKNSSISERINLLEDIFADAFETAQLWHLACKAVVRLEDMERLAKDINSWSDEGYATEKPLYFARAALQLFSESQAQLGMKLVKESTPLIDEAKYTDATGNPYASLAIWHAVIIMADMLSLTARPGPDKTKIFKQLTTRYGPFIAKTDPKLMPLFVATGEKLFGVVSDAPQGMDLLGMLGGGGKPGAPGGLDMGKMMQMMQQMRR